MFTAREFVQPASIQEAWELNQKKANSIVGGMGWMKMSKRDLGTVIDLSKLELNQITETETEFVIGAMVSLRQLEMHEGFNSYFAGAAKDCLKHIVGVQFRNCATIGGSVWLRPGFSDPLTLFLALDSTVELYTGSDEHTFLPMAEFVTMKKDRSIVVSVHVKKDNRKVAYETMRNTETDFPVLAVAVSKDGNHYAASVGARPAVAQQILADSVEGLVEKASALSYQDNLRGSAEYRRMLSKVLIERAANKLAD